MTVRYSGGLPFCHWMTTLPHCVMSFVETSKPSGAIFFSSWAAAVVPSTTVAKAAVRPRASPSIVNGDCGARLRSRRRRE